MKSGNSKKKIGISLDFFNLTQKSHALFFVNSKKAYSHVPNLSNVKKSSASPTSLLEISTMKYCSYHQFQLAPTQNCLWLLRGMKSKTVSSSRCVFSLLKSSLVHTPTKDQLILMIKRTQSNSSSFRVRTKFSADYGVTGTLFL